MRQPLVAAAILVSATFVTGADDEKYTSKAGRYAVAFPAGSKVKTEAKDTGALKLNFATVELKGATAYAVMYVDLPEQVKDVPVKDILEAAEKGAVKESKGKVETSKEIAFGEKKYPGREVLIDKDGDKIRSRIILVETRAYVVVVGGSKDFAKTKEGDRFLDSFELTK